MLAAIVICSKVWFATNSLAIKSSWIPLRDYMYMFSCLTGYNGDWIDKNREINSNDSLSSMPSVPDVQVTTGENNLASPWDTTYHTENTPVNPCSITPAIADIDETTRDDIPTVIYNPWSSPVKDAVPALSAYHADDDSVLTEEKTTRDLSDDYISTKANSNADPQTNFTKTKSPLLSIPTVIISEPGEKRRKLSTVIAPDIDKLSPTSGPVKSEESDQNNKGRKGKSVLKLSEAKSKQLNSYDSQQWLAHENKIQSQVQFSTKGRLRSPRRSLMRSRKTADIKISVSVNQYRKAVQVTLPCEKCDRDIPCFSKFLMESCRTEETSKTGSQFSGRTVKNFDEFETIERQERTCMSLPFDETEQSQIVQSQTGMRDGCISGPCDSKNNGHSPEIESSKTKIAINIEVSYE